MLTKHFSLEEMMVSQAAARNGIKNDPPADAEAALQQLCFRVLEPIREHFGPVHVSSGYRSPKVNKIIGGAGNSQHCSGEAADIIVPGTSLIELAQWIMNNLNYDQLIYEFGQWIHVSYGPRMRQQELTAKHVGGKTQYIEGLKA